MDNKKKSILLLVIICMAGINVSAYDFSFDGIYYNLNASDQTAEVTYKSLNDGSNYSGNVVIPSFIGLYRVTKIGYKAFEGCSGLTSIKIPDEVWKVEGHAFDGCCKLRSVTLGSGLKEIEDDAFRDCI